MRKVIKSVLYVASTHLHIINFHLPYLKFFKEQGFIVHVVAGGESIPIPYADEVIALPFEKSIYSLKNWKLVFNLSKLIRENNYNVICTHTTLASFFTRLAATKTDAYIINTVHGYLFDDQSPVYRRQVLLLAEKVVAKRTHLLMTMNRADFEFANRYSLCAGRLVSIPGMGVDFSRFRRPTFDEKGKARSWLSLNQSDFVLVYAAEFSERKNQEMLIRGMVKLPKRCKLLLLGDGAKLDFCRKLSDSLRVADRVVFTGHVSNTPQYYQVADVAVSSSRIEGLPFNIMECMSIGLPVIASKVKGHEELIETGKNGYLFPFNDENAFCQSVRKLLDDPMLVRKMGDESTRISAQFSIEKVYSIITSIYSKALGIPLECSQKTTNS